MMNEPPSCMLHFSTPRIHFSLEPFDATRLVTISNYGTVITQLSTCELLPFIDGLVRRLQHVLPEIECLNQPY
jgi:hypothetical protein